MSVFNEEDRDTIKSLGATMGGFVALTVFLIVCALLVS